MYIAQKWRVSGHFGLKVGIDFDIYLSENWTKLLGCIGGLKGVI